jgi:hypothetical protein
LNTNIVIEHDDASYGNPWDANVKDVRRVSIDGETLWEAPKERYHPDRFGVTFWMEQGEFDLYEYQKDSRGNTWDTVKDSYSLAKIFKASYR